MSDTQMQEWLDWLETIQQGIVATEDPNKVRDAVYYCDALQEDIKDKIKEGGEES